MGELDELEIIADMVRAESDHTTRRGKSAAARRATSINFEKLCQQNRKRAGFAKRVSPYAPSLAAPRWATR